MFRIYRKSRHACCALLILVGLLSGPTLASAAIAFVAAGSADSGTTASTSASVARPAGTAAGNLLVVQLAVRAAATTITAPAGWTLVRRDTSGTTISSAIYYKFYATGDATPISFTLGTASLYSIGILAYSGVDPTTPTDADAGQTNASSTTITTPSVTQTQHNDQEVRFYSYAQGTLINNAPSQGTTRYRDVSTNGTAANNVGIMATDEAQTKAAVSGTATTTHPTPAAINIGQTVALMPLVRLRAEWLMEQTAWTGAAGEVVDTSGNGFNGTAVSGATTAVTTPANGTNPGTCRYGVFSGGTTAGRVNMGGAQMGLGGGAGVTAMAWARWGINPASGNNWGALITNQSTATADVGQIWLEESQTNANWEFAVSTSVARVYVFSSAVPTANVWTHVAGVYDGAEIRIYINGVLSGTTTHSGTITPDSAAYILNVGSWAFNSSNFRSFQGFIDEARVYDGALNAADIVTAMNVTRPCIIGPDHYRVQNNATGINCQAETVTISAHTTGHAAADATGKTITITAARTAGATGNHGDYTLVTGSGTLNNGTADDGVATYAFAAGETSVTLAFKDTWVQTVDFVVTDGVATDTSGTASADSGYQQALAFSSSGFRFIDASNGNLANQIAGTTSPSYFLQAIQTGTGGCTTGSCTGACTVPTFASSATVGIDLAFRCDNPITCQSGQLVSITNGGTSTIAGNPASGVTTYTTKNMQFGANGQAAFTLNYPDVGAISLFARYNIPLGTGGASGNLMTGSSNSFVVKPANFTLSAVKRTSDNFANPAATVATGPAFITAGSNFTATVTAVNSLGAATPNFGKEIAPETVKLTPNLVTGLGLTNNPALANPTAFGTFSSGAATGTTFSWGEVGIITLTPSIGDADYLGAGDVTGTASGNVGRFYPFDFAMTRNTPAFASACSSNFTYVGQPFTYATQPIATVTARNAAGGTTQNYVGNFMKIASSSATPALGAGRYTYFDALGGGTTPVLTAALHSPLASDPIVGTFSGGTGTLTFNADATFTRGSPVSPFDADIALNFSLVDSDGVATARVDGVAATNPVRFGTATAGNGITFTSAKAMRYGRLVLSNAFGSELLDLPVPMETQYFSNGIYQTNTLDSCTTITTANVKLSSSTATVTGISAGKGSIKITKPGSAAAIDVCVDLDGSVPTDTTCVATSGANLPWLQWKWSGAAYDRDPKAKASFGAYKGADEFIYFRENF